MGFSRGDRVHFAGLGTGVVMEARGNDRYAIAIKGRVVVASARDLERAGPEARVRRSTVKSADEDEGGGGTDVASIDLHGRTTAEAVALVEEFINAALLGGHGEIHIVHGRGGGKVKAAVHKLLGALAAVADFHLDPRNPGVTIVKFA